MNELVKELLNNEDLKYKEFNSSLLPNVPKNSFIGIRIPVIKKITKDFMKNHDYESFMKELPHKYFEEYIAHGELISQTKDINKCLEYLDEFLPYVDNWEVCDTLKPKVFKKNLDLVYKRIKKWIKSKDEYTVRFAIVTLLSFYLDDFFKDEINDLVSDVKREEYYINMAIAWYFSYALVKQYDKTIHIFEDKVLDKWVHNKSIQKAIESYRISDEKKTYLRSLKV